jgi:hypothetical protein
VSISEQQMPEQSPIMLKDYNVEALLALLCAPATVFLLKFALELVSAPLQGF